MKGVRTLVLATMLTLSMGITVFAVEPKSLDEITAGNSVTVEQTAPSEETQGTQNNNSGGGLGGEHEYTNRSFVDSMGSAMEMTQETKISSDFSKTANYYGSIVFQWLAILVSVGALIMVGIDMVYIILPFTRGFLGAGAAPQGGAAGGQAGLASGGMGGMSGGMGGMSGGMGMGGMSGGMGLMGGRGRMGMNGMGGQMGQQQGQAGMGMGGMQYVSNAAINAVAMEGQNSALINYIKSMGITIILSSVILVLAGTGVLGKLGLAIGSKLAALITNLIGSLA